MRSCGSSRPTDKRIIRRDGSRVTGELTVSLVEDPDGVTLIFVQIPGDHPLRRDARAG